MPGSHFSHFHTNRRRATSGDHPREVAEPWMPLDLQVSLGVAGPSEYRQAQAAVRRGRRLRR